MFENWQQRTIMAPKTRERVLAMVGIFILFMVQRHKLVHDPARLARNQFNLSNNLLLALILGSVFAIMCFITESGLRRTLKTVCLIGILCAAQLGANTLHVFLNQYHITWYSSVLEAISAAGCILLIEELRPASSPQDA